MSKSSSSTKIITALSPTHYQDNFYFENDLTPAIGDFFSRINSLDIHNISDFLSTLERKNRRKKQPEFSEENLQKLLSKINHLSDTSKTEFSAPDLDKILNSFAGLGFKKETLAGLQIQDLATITNEKIDSFRSRDIANVINGFARLGYDKNDLKIDPAKLSGCINNKIFNFSAQDTLISFHAFAQLGYGQEELGRSVRNLLTQSRNPYSRKPIAAFDSRETATLIHSLAKMEMFDELFYPNLRNQIKIPSATTDLTPESAFSLLQAQMLCDLVAGEKFFDQNTALIIAKKCTAETNRISQLQQTVANNLPRGTTTQEYSLYKISEISLRDVDIFHQIANQNYFIEVDGPSHFYFSKDAAKQVPHQKNSATTQRDFINETAILKLAELNRDQDFHYLTLPFFEIENLTKEELSDFLEQKFASSLKIKPSVIEQESTVEIAAENESEKVIKTATTKKIKAKKLPKQTVESSVPTTDPKTEKLIEIFFTTTNLSGFSEKFAHSPNVGKIFERAQSEINGQSRSDITAALIKAGAPLPQDAATMLGNAISKNQQDIIEALITTGIDVNVILPNGQNPLNFAAQRNPLNIKIINNLISAGANVEAAGIDGAKASLLLQQSLAEAQIESACAFLKLNIVTTPKGSLKRAVELESPALVAAITEKAQFNNQNEEAESALRLSINNKNLEISDILLSAGISLDKIDFTKAENFLHYVAKNGSSNAFLQLAKNEKFAQLVFSNGATPLHFAAYEGQSEIVATLTRSKAPLDAATRIGSTPLHLATRNGSAETVQILIDAGANVQAETCVKGSLVTPLISAVVFNQAKVVKILAGRTTTNDILKTQLFNRTIEDKHPEIFQILIDEWRPNQKQLNEFLLFSAKDGLLEFAKILVDKGANVNFLSTERDTTPLQIASRNGHLNVIEFLINNGAEPDLVNQKGFSPLGVAALHRRSDVIRILIEKGATNSSSGITLPKEAVLLIQEVFCEIVNSTTIPSTQPSDTSIKSLQENNSRSTTKK